MRVRTYFLLLAAFCLFASLPVRAQEEQQPPQGQTPGSNQGASIMPASSVDSQGIRRYLLGPGDTLDVRVFGQSDLNWSGEVEPDGNITSLPFIEAPIRAQCRTDKEVQKDIIAAYSKFLRSPQISVRVTGRNSRVPATIMGAVATPARVQMLRPVRLNEALTASGGITERANGDIQIMHTQPLMCPEPGEVDDDPVATSGVATNPIKVYKWTELVAGKPEANPIVRPGDLITVMEAKPVYVVGSVAAPQPVLLREQYTLSRVLAMVGNPVSGAKINDVRIYRKKKDSSDTEIVRVDFEAIKKKKREDILLQPYDIVEVPKGSDTSPGALLKSLLHAGVGTAVGAPGQILTYKVFY